MSAGQRVRAAWSDWSGAHELGPYTLGVEEEAMLLDPRTWALAHRIDDLLPRLSVDAQNHVSAETHGSAFEVQTNVRRTVGEAVDDLLRFRVELEETLETLGLRAAVSGTHPFAIWQEIAISGGERYQFVYGSMRELARREPTFALHVHVGIPDEETAVRVNDRMRVHLPLLLALSANSPFWQGRDSGLASARTPLFQAFPRVGVPRAFGTYDVYAETVDLLIRTEAVPEATFLWWDARPQPALGTIEIRVMDAQTRCRDTAALVALVQCLVKLEAEQGYASDLAIASQEVISENRFLAARDGVDAALIDPDLETRIPVPDLVADLLAICRPHAQELGCEDELAAVTDLIEDPPAKRQITTARHAPSLGRLVERLSDRFAERPGV
ncbi:MAG: YbdK family carboxylate-amine ligase [Solirubrobacterales bacterium]|nr:YbdK family carboxylate-amine ligase [Solirubrobacterales bacterium]MCO5328055.1 YbdK family carboxylate-amine ligase [Solirubrobacterales bacterium]